MSPKTPEHPEKHPAKHAPKHPHPAGSSGAADDGTPAFGQPVPGPDETAFKVPHPSDDPLYNKVNSKLVEPFPAPRGGTEPILTLEEVWGTALGAAKVQAITTAGQIVFHSVGDTGNVKAPTDESLVADAMQADLATSAPNAAPAFFFHLGDVVYSFGEAKYYYDQLYEPYRTYQNPILGLAGNHDGLIYTGDPAPTLDAWLRNFCATTPVITPEAGGLIRTAMIQPGVFYTFDSPFVRLLAIYSNVLEDPGVISTEGNTRPALNDTQLTYLRTALARCKSENYAGAVIIAVHHPPYTAGTTHGGSPLMLADLDAACAAADFWPHAVFSGHAHNYQRFTRTLNPGTSGATNIVYMVAGHGGHGLDKIRKVNGVALRVPYVVDDTLTLENYDDTHYGFLRVTVDAMTLRIDAHQSGGSSAQIDTVSIDLGTRTSS